MKIGKKSQGIIRFVFIVTIIVLFISCILLYMYNYMTTVRYTKILPPKPLLTQTPLPKKVYILVIIEQPNFCNDTCIEFMYKPLIISLYELISYLYPNIIIEYKYFERDTFNHNFFDEINPNDMIIKFSFHDTLPMPLLKEKNIYVVNYNTEPFIQDYMSDEVWLYSRQMFNSYEKKHDKQIIKFVPIICEENNLPIVPYYLYNKNNLDLVFLGTLALRTDKSSIIDNLKTKHNLKEVYDLWDDTTFNNFVKEKPRIYLNILRNGTSALPSFRINKLLSYSAIVISDHVDRADEELYKDIVYFCDTDKIEEVFEELSRKTGEELQHIANERYRLFYNKFGVKNASQLILEK